MSDLFEKSIRTLELPAVLERLAPRPPARRPRSGVSACGPPPTRTRWPTCWTRRTRPRSGWVCTAVRPSPGVKDVAPALTRADQGGVLNTRELLDVAGVLTAARRVSDYDADRQGEATAIDRLFSALHVNRYLEDRIRSAILDGETIADTASPELADIRRSMRVAATKGRQILQRIISSPSYAKVLQEALITQRDGRFVVPVKAGVQGQSAGIGA